jgi:hypothetical protein
MTPTQNLIENFQATFQAVSRQRITPPFRSHLGMSQIGDECWKKLWLGFRWTLRPNFEPRIIRLFDTGNRYEERFVEFLRSAGVTVQDTHPDTGQQFRFSHANGHVGGSLDAFAIGFVEYPNEWVVAEFKTMGEKAFADILKHGLQKSKPVYWGQVHQYMRKSNTKRAFFMAVNKNTDALYSEWVILDEAFADSLLAKGEEIVYGPVPERVALSSTDYRCRMCDFRPVCWHRGEEPDINCRTCAHSEPACNGTWTCSYSGATDIDCYNPCGAYSKHAAFIKPSDIIISISL